MTQNDIDRVSHAVGRPVEESDIRALSFARPDDLIETKNHPFPFATVIEVAGDDGHQAMRAIVPRPTGPLLVNLRVIAKKGQGFDLFRSQASVAWRLGFQRILSTAAGKKDDFFTGYYVWPRWGFTGPIPESVRRKMPSEWRKDRFPPKATLLDLMEHKDGRDFWRENGVPVNVWFDVSDMCSPSWKALLAYGEGRQ